MAKLASVLECGEYSWVPDFMQQAVLNGPRQQANTENPAAEWQGVHLEISQTLGRQGP